MLANTRGNVLTAKIIGAALEVYKDLGAGLREDVYQKALQAELENRGLMVQRHVQIDDDSVNQLAAGEPANPAANTAFSERPTHPVCTNLMVENLVLIKIKARPHLAPRDEIAQISSYLHTVQKPYGLLLNFGRSSVYFKRIPRPKV